LLLFFKKEGLPSLPPRFAVVASRRSAAKQFTATRQNFVALPWIASAKPRRNNAPGVSSFMRAGITGYQVHAPMS
jgi:hypothetical protein